MSRRKQQAIEAAKEAAQTEKKEISINQGWPSKLVRPPVLASVGVGLLLCLAAIGATVGNNRASSGSASADSWLGKLFPGNSVNPSATAAAPPPSPTPQLLRENIYSGSRLLAVEDANAASSSYQPADLVVWRLSTGVWYVRDSTDGTIAYNTFGGTPGDAPAPADFDGDGLTDFCVYRRDTTAHLGTWYIQSHAQAAAGNFTGIQFGSDTDVPVPADYDGDGRADIAVWRAGTNAQFIILKSSTNLAEFVTLGTTGDKPLPADYDSDGRADAAIYRPSNSNWMINQTSNNQTTVQPFGVSTDEAVRGDFDGDGRFDIAVRRNSDNKWYYKQAQTGGATTTLTFTGGFTMQSGDKAVAGDYDGDAKTDIAVWRPSTGYWYIQKSASNALRQDQWGAPDDVPIAAPMKR